MALVIESTLAVPVAAGFVIGLIAVIAFFLCKSGWFKVAVVTVATVGAIGVVTYAASVGVGAAIGGVALGAFACVGVVAACTYAPSVVRSVTKWIRSWF